MMDSRPIALTVGTLVTALLSACGGSGPPAAPSLLILSLDTTRPDALSCYGGRDADTPHLDRLADEGVLYERAYSAAPLTLPAHTSLMTGLYPLRHGVRNNGIGALSDEAVTLAERARDAGYQTAAFLGGLRTGSGLRALRRAAPGPRV